MVRALLAGRKTQTRRLLRNPEYYGCPTGDCPHEKQVECDQHMAWLSAREVGYASGDRLYVREHWSTHPAFDGIAPRDIKRGSMIYTRADYAWHNNGDWIGAPFGKHRQGMHMPRWASRLWLEVNEVRVEQLQKISETDAIAEGIQCDTIPDGFLSTGSHNSFGFDGYSGFATAVSAYSVLWNSLHAQPGTIWADNPWIVAITFSVHHGNIDQVQHG